jgi:hypothetical protein
MDDEIASVVRIDDPDIDITSIYARIREGLNRREPPPPVAFPTFERPAAPDLGSGFFSAELTWRLEQLNASFDQVWVELSLIEQNFPIVGAFVNRYKRDLHRLVISYVNALATRQQAINADVVRAINQLAAEIDAADLATLRRDLDDALARLTALEQRAASHPDAR